MRALVLPLLLILLAPATQAFGITAPAAEVIIDAPLLTPLVVATPTEPAPTPASFPQDDAEQGWPAGHAEAPLDAFALDDVIETPVDVSLTLTAPRAMESHPVSGKLARMERSEAPLPWRAPPAPVRALDRPLHTGGQLPTRDATPTLMISISASTSAPLPLAPARAQTFTPLAPDDLPPTWPAIGALGALLFLIVPVALYHRIRAHHLGRSDTRQMLLRLVEENPGLSASKLARAMGMDASTTLYHLRRLSRAQLVVAEGAERRPHWFLVGTQGCTHRARVIAARRGEYVLAAVRAAPGLHKSHLARGLAISRAAADWHLVTLERAGLVRLERKASRVHVFPISF